MTLTFRTKLLRSDNFFKSIYTLEKYEFITVKVIAEDKTFSMLKYVVNHRDMLESTYVGYCFKAQLMK